MAWGEWTWQLGAFFFGGMLGPMALMFGLTLVSGSTASLLLNLESVLTALIAWFVFRENADRRIVLGMIAIVGGGAVLSWPTGNALVSNWLGPLAIAAACSFWALDNNLTRKVSASDALFIASSKGLIAGVVNTSLAIAFGAHLPSLPVAASTLLVGLLGYGLSLVLFVLALRGLGADSLVVDRYPGRATLMQCPGVPLSGSQATRPEPRAESGHAALIPDGSALHVPYARNVVARGWLGRSLYPFRATTPFSPSREARWRVQGVVPGFTWSAWIFVLQNTGHSCLRP